MARGGRRRNAGRPKTGRCRDAPHRVRPDLSARHPVHVVLRVKERIGRLRTGEMYRVIRRVMERYLGRADFRIVHLSIQHNHLHFLVEAVNRDALRAGMQSLAINCARALNDATNQCGKVFEYRYHATVITTPRQARNSLAYVLNNWRRHREDVVDARIRAWPVDPYSSGVTFTGWSKRPVFELPASYVPLPVSPPRTALLRGGYEEFGRIDPFERPGPLWR
jgi:REP element-mobilizing transposase RayT